MGQDIRELLKQDQDPQGLETLSAGHRERFEARLGKAFPQEKKTAGLWLRIAAVFLVVLGSGFFLLYERPVQVSTPIADSPLEDELLESTSGSKAQESVTLADISPEFRKVEEYYMANLNMGLAKLELNEENKALIDAFMGQLANLDNEYGRLNSEITKNGPNSETIQALINNLQLRLDLLFKLKGKLDELNKEKNENLEKKNA